MQKLEEEVKAVIRDVPDFPKKGIIFKDITTLLANPSLNRRVLEQFQIEAKVLQPDVIVGIDSRGFLYGNTIATALNIPFAPVRKEGKLPYATNSLSYELEYGESVLEIHVDAIKPGDRVVIHDDLLATGGTAVATTKLVRELGGVVVGYSFLINLSFLPGANKLSSFSDNLFAVATY